jgi:hypothetical protein
MLLKITDMTIIHRAMTGYGDENRKDFRRDYF